VTSPLASETTPPGPVLAVTRQGIELRNPSSGWLFCGGVLVTGVVAAVAAVDAWPSSLDRHSVGLTALLCVFAVVSGRLSFRTSGNHLQAAPTLLYVATAAALFGPVSAVAVGATAGAASILAPLQAQAFSAGLGALQGVVAAGLASRFGLGAPRPDLLAECAAISVAGGAVWATGQAAMYLARTIPMTRLWRYEMPSTCGEVVTAVIAAPVLVILYRDSGMTLVFLFAALLLATFAVFRRYRNRLLSLYDQVERLSMLDALTGISNRRAFDERLEHECRRSARGHGQFALVLIDLDRFKSINDVHGHAAGDFAIREASGRLASRLRREDMLARIGGDELAVIATDIDSHEALVALASSLKEALSAEPFVHLTDEITVTASIGVALATTATDRDEVLRRADAALYEAKASGRNRFAFADCSGGAA
jgi:diguanylate cyclase (GGDEF)-like protein